MIDDDIAEIIKDSHGCGERLNEMVDSFRRGRPIEDASLLLDSANPVFIALGAWILSELPTTCYDCQDIVTRLRRLVCHENAEVRFNALAALFPILDASDPATEELFKEMSLDENAGVRMQAVAALSRLSRR